MEQMDNFLWGPNAITSPCGPHMRAHELNALAFKIGLVAEIKGSVHQNDIYHKLYLAMNTGLFRFIWDFCHYPNTTDMNGLVMQRMNFN